MSTTAAAPPLLRDRSGGQRVTNIELFFDLVYVFAVTQLSHQLLAGPTIAGAVQTAVLLALVLLAWAYTTWVTNWLDPDRLAIRLMLVVLMLVSLAMSAALPYAFGRFGLVVGGAFALMQIGRTAFVVAVLPRGPLRVNFERVTVWCVVSGALAVTGGLAPGRARVLVWLLTVGVDVLGSSLGFMVPGLGRSRTSDWTIEGGHFAERCQGFILIALGESIVIIGGPALFLAGHAAFKFVVWRVVPWTRLAGVAVLALLGLATPVLPAIALAACVTVVVALVAAADRLTPRRSPSRH